MTKQPSRRGPGSNQHQDKPPLARTGVAASPATPSDLDVPDTSRARKCVLENCSRMTKEPSGSCWQHKDMIWGNGEFEGLSVEAGYRIKALSRPEPPPDAPQHDKVAYLNGLFAQQTRGEFVNNANVGMDPEIVLAMQLARMTQKQIVEADQQHAVRTVDGVATRTGMAAYTTSQPNGRRHDNESLLTGTAMLGMCHPAIHNATHGIEVVGVIDVGTDNDDERVVIMSSALGEVERVPMAAAADRMMHWSTQRWPDWMDGYTDQERAEHEATEDYSYGRMSKSGAEEWFYDHVGQDLFTTAVKVDLQGHIRTIWNPGPRRLSRGEWTGRYKMNESETGMHYVPQADVHRVSANTLHYSRIEPDGHTTHMLYSARPIFFPDFVETDVPTTTSRKAQS